MKVSEGPGWAYLRSLFRCQESNLAAFFMQFGQILGATSERGMELRYNTRSFGLCLRAEMFGHLRRKMPIISSPIEAEKVVKLRKLMEDMDAKRVIKPKPL